MPSERIQRRIDALLDEADTAVTSGDWPAVAEKARAVLAIDAENEDAVAFLKMAEANGATRSAVAEAGPTLPPSAPAPSLPATLGAGRYAVRRFLGEGGRKRVYLAHDSRLDREVAFCVIRAEGLDLTGRQRVLREAQSVARLGQHPNLVTVHDIGEDNGNPYIVQEYMAGGDVAGFIEKAEDHRLPVERTLQIAKEVCRGLSFIHAGGMVHRDLKPANIFLATDGAARIGDFGLAVALDRSRITQYGLMLGTVSYMPPEQALGGESTPQADLYSLGAMLYEMVTGRPPFLGDDPTAVISQHINAPPVAPSWVTEHCPPSLEEVILHLLAKVPAERPASASAVLAALEKVDPNEKSASHSDSNVLDRLARGVFVGREKELERLRKAFDEAFAGRGGLVMLVGEPGIGKTRTTQELETYARMRGANVLWGRAHESAGAPPYWPWKQVGDSHARFVPPADLAGDLDPEQVAELGRIFPVLRAGAAAPAIADPESAQFRLFDAYSAFIRAGAQRAPLLIVLDDLHWADKPSLLLLQHFARELSRLRVLVVCTYRDTDLSRTHPLSEALASLNREAGFLRISLRGLSRDEVEAYIRAAANVSPPARVLDRIFEDTEGNPFFLSEVVNLMTQEGTLARESVSDIAVPEGVREALGRRLDRISREANELLQVCAVAGREFSYDTLTLLDERSEDEILRLIEEAVGARVIEEMDQPGRYRFTHALMQETLLDELTTTRRVRLHGQVGEALEQRWGARADERASRLAEHFVEAAMLSPRFAEKAVRYAKLAAAQAEAQTAWDEAANWYERVVSLVSGSDDGLGEDEAQLLVALGVCQRNGANNRAAWRNLMRAITLFRERGERGAFAGAVAELGMIPAPAARQNPLNREALELLGSSDPHLEARLLFLRGGIGLSAVSDYTEPLRRIEAIVAQHGFPDIQARLLSMRGMIALADLDLANAVHFFAQSRDQLLALALPGEANNPILFLGIVPLLSGDVEVAAVTAYEARALSEKHHAMFAKQNIELRLAGLAFAQGDWQRFEALHADMASVAGNYALKLQLAARAELDGDLAKAMSLLPVPEMAGGVPPWVAQISAAWARTKFLAGDLEAAAAEFERWRQAMLVMPDERRFSFGRFFAINELGEALAALADEATAQIVYEELGRCEELRWDPLAPFGTDVLRGSLALRLGLVDAAESHFQTGEKWSHEHGLSVEQARNVEGLSQVAVARNDTAAAGSLLDEAAALYRQQSAKLYLDRVIRRKVELQGLTSDDMGSSIVALNQTVQSQRPDLSAHAASDGTVTLMFSDIQDSTPLNEHMGDAKWMEVLRAHNAVIEYQVKAHLGYVVKTMGDGYMVAFKSAADGLRCAIAIQQAIGETPGLGGVRVRIGLHTGEMMREGDDFFGRHVNLAARVAGHASGGEIFVSGVVREVVKGQSFVFEDKGERPMKGFEQPVRVWAARWA